MLSAVLAILHEEQGVLGSQYMDYTFPSLHPSQATPTSAVDVGVDLCRFGSVC